MSFFALTGVHLIILSGVPAVIVLLAYARLTLSNLWIAGTRRRHDFAQTVPELPSSTVDLPGRTRPLMDSGRMPHRTRASRLSAVLVLCAGSAAAADTWPSFQNGGQIAISTAVPRNWSADSGMAWSAAIDGYGQSSPVVWNGQVYVTSVSGPKKETCHVAAYALADGKKLWQHDLKNPSPVESTGYVSKAAPTPAVDANGLVCFFEGGNLVGLTHEGKPRWERNLVAEYGAIDSRFGVSASVEQSADAAYVWVERETEPYVMAISKKTGENLWKVSGAGSTSWASPRLIPVEGNKQHLVLSAIGHLIGLDPSTGERLWTFNEIAGNSTPTPIPAGEGRFLIGATTGQGGDSATKANESNGLIGISRSGAGIWKATWIWHAARATSSFGSPVVAGGNAYFVNRTGVLYCLDEKTGEENYAQRVGESIWATPIATKDAILLFGKSGTVTAVAAGKTFEKLAESAAWRPDSENESGPKKRPQEGGPPGASGAVLYGAAIAEGKLLLRRGDRLICIKEN